MIPNISQIDQEIREVVIRLNEAHVETDWSCSGQSADHMCIRPTIQARWDGRPLVEQKKSIEDALQTSGLTEYWLSLVFTTAGINTHGGEPTWLIQWPGRFDWLALPAAFSAKYQSDDYLVEEI